MSSISDSNTTETIPLQYAVMIYQQGNQKGWGTQASNASNGICMFTGWLSESFSYSMSAQYDSPFQAVVASGMAPAMSLFGVKLMAPVSTAQIWSGSETPEFSIEVQLAANTDPLLEIRDPIVNLLSMVTPKLGVDGRSKAAALMSPGPYVDPAKVWEELKKAFPSISKMEGYLREDQAGNTTDSSNVTAKTTGLVSPQKAAANLPNTKTGSTKDTSKSSTSSANDSESVLTASKNIRDTLTNQISISIGSYLYFPSVVITNVQCEFQNQIGPGGWPMQAQVTIQFKPLFLPTDADLITMFGLSGRSS